MDMLASRFFTMHYSTLQHSAVWLFTLIAIVFSSVSAATSISPAPMVQTAQHFNTLESDAQHHASPCTGMAKTGLTADFPCSDSAKHSNEHCANCMTNYAALPTSLDIRNHPSSPQKYSDHTESIPNLTLPNLSRPPIQSVWF
ncbi:hypothetical protein ACGRL8_17790 [Vibrio rumoiensis]|uniref:DUF2946 domain-containing protein n=1 Tax=Vibrio rumoiensis TaxID=76258 RepID=A0ABW7IZV8_9VIBR